MSLDLETRVTNRKQELIAELIEHKKNSSRIGAAESIDRIKGRLQDWKAIAAEGKLGTMILTGATTEAVRLVAEAVL